MTPLARRGPKNGRQHGNADDCGEHQDRTRCPKRRRNERERQLKASPFQGQQACRSQRDQQGDDVFFTHCGSRVLRHPTPVRRGAIHQTIIKPEPWAIGVDPGQPEVGSHAS